MDEEFQAVSYYAGYGVDTLYTIEHTSAKNPLGREESNVLGCISKHGVGPLITIDGTMDQHQYLEVLNDYFIP